MQFSLRKYNQDESGTTAVEFALVSTAFLSLVFGIFEIGRMFLAQSTFQYSLENATRYVLVNGSGTTEEEVTDLILADMENFGVGADDVVIDVNYTTSSGLDFIEIDATYNFTSILPFVPDGWEALAMTSNTRFPVLEPYDDGAE